MFVCVCVQHYRTAGVVLWGEEVAGLGERWVEEVVAHAAAAPNLAAWPGMAY